MKASVERHALASRQVLFGFRWRNRLIVKTLLKLSEYRDSVALMLLARELGTLPGVADVSVVMGTPRTKRFCSKPVC